MKYSEFKKAVEGLSKKYKVIDSGGTIYVMYKSNQVVFIEKEAQFVFETKTVQALFRAAILPDGYSKPLFTDMLPFSRNLYMLCAELAMTPPDERKEVQLWAVRSKNPVAEGVYLPPTFKWVCNVNESIADLEDSDIAAEVPQNSPRFQYRMPLELAKSHLTAYRELVKVEDDK